MRELRGDWRDIFNGFSVALDVKKLLVGFVAMVATLVFGFIGPFIFASLTNPTLWSDLVHGDYASLCNLYCQVWNSIWGVSIGYGILVVAVLYLFLVMAWSYFGGVISRIAAINLTKDEGLETRQGLSFGTKKFLSFLAPWIIPLLGFLFFWFCNFAGGVVGRIPYVGELLMVIFLPLAILSGFIMVFIAVGFFFGGCLFSPTIAVEGSDSFDAMSRSFSYLYAKPWHYIFYNLTALVYGVLTTAFVWVFGYLMIAVALWAGGLGMGAKFGSITNILNLNLIGLPAAGAETIPITYHIASYILAAWLVIIVGFILAYVISFHFSVQTIIYLLLRKKVDDIDMKEVYEEKEEEEITPSETAPTPPAPSAEAPKPEEKPPEKPEEKPPGS